MKIAAEIWIIPIGVGVSLSKYIAACEEILIEAGLDPQLHAYGTNAEGDWDTVMAAVKRCHELLHEMGVPRVSTSVKLGTRVDREQTMGDKVRSVKYEMEKG